MPARSTPARKTGPVCPGLRCDIAPQDRDASRQRQVRSRHDARYPPSAVACIVSATWALGTARAATRRGEQGRTVRHEKATAHP